MAFFCIAAGDVFDRIGDSDVVWDVWEWGGGAAVAGGVDGEADGGDGG